MRVFFIFVENIRSSPLLAMKSFFSPLKPFSYTICCDQFYEYTISYVLIFITFFLFTIRSCREQYISQKRAVKITFYELFASSFCDLANRKIELISFVIRFIIVKKGVSKLGCSKITFETWPKADSVLLFFRCVARKMSPEGLRFRRR